MNFLNLVLFASWMTSCVVLAQNYVDGDNFKASWVIEGQTATYTVEAKTQGWGIICWTAANGRGHRTGTDSVTFWIDGTTPMAVRTQSTNAREEHSVVANGGVEVLEGSTTATGGIRVVFSRPLTGLENGQKLIWGVGSQTPTLNGNNINYNRHTTYRSANNIQFLVSDTPGTEPGDGTGGGVGGEPGTGGGVGGEPGTGGGVGGEPGTGGGVGGEPGDGTGTGGDGTGTGGDGSGAVGGGSVPGDEGTGVEGDDNMIMYIGIGAGSLVAVGAAFTVARRRRNSMVLSSEPVNMNTPMNPFGPGGGPMSPVPAPQAKPRASDWETAVDPKSGQTYYFNRSTGKRSWSAPPEFEL